MLRYLKNSEIDKQKWNQCISNSPNGLIYAEAGYLDSLADHWDALVKNDYEAVMPLVWRSKFGIRYLYQPAFVQQGGIFSLTPISKAIIIEFINIASQHFKFAEIALNFASADVNLTYQCSLRNNFLLSLEKSYEHIFNNYKPYIKERLQRLQKFNLEYAATDDVDKAIEIYKSTYEKRIQKTTSNTYEQFKKRCNHYLQNERAIVREVREQSTKELLAIVLLLKDKNRIYNLASSITENGKKKLANYFLYDRIFQEFSEQGLCFDFEGSDIPGVAYFYEKFADTNQVYPFIKWNNLPVMIKIFKR